MKGFLIRSTVLSALLALALCALSSIGVQSQAKGEWRAIGGWGETDFMLRRVYAQRDNYILIGKPAGENLVRAFQLINGVPTPLKDTAGAEFFPHQDYCFFVGNRLVACHAPRGDLGEEPDPVFPKKPAALCVIESGVAKPLTLRGKPLVIERRENRNTVSARGCDQPCVPFFHVIEKSPGGSGVMPQLLSDRLMMLTGTEVKQVEMPENATGSMCFQDGRVLVICPEKLQLFDGKALKTLKDAAGKDITGSDKGRWSGCGEYLLCGRENVPAALFHIKGETLLPVPFEKDYAFRDFYSLGSTTLVCTYNTKSRLGYREGKLSVLKGEAMEPFTPAKDLKEAAMKHIIALDKMLVVSVQDGQAWAHYLIDEKGLRAITLPKGAVAGPLGGAMLWRETVVICYMVSGMDSRIASIDKNGNASPALDEKGEPAQIQGTAGCYAGAQGFFVFGDPARVAWYRLAK